MRSFFCKIKWLAVFFILVSSQNATAQKNKSATEAQCQTCEAEPAGTPQKLKMDLKKIIDITCGLWINGRASFYGKNDGFSGKKTASGQILKKFDLTAAHKTLPFGTLVKVRLPSTDREVVVRINDRGPFTPGRTIDLNYAAAKSIGLDQVGVGDVEMQVCSQRSQN